MNTFLSKLTKNDTLGENGMPAHSTTDSAVLDLFFLLGTRPDETRVKVAVTKAFQENPELTMKVLFQSRDIRGGKGERDSFRRAIHLLATVEELPPGLIKLIPEYGRWDDLLVLSDTNYDGHAFMAIEEALKAKNGLCAKWMPRKGEEAARLRRWLDLKPKEYRKLLVGLTKVVESQMCSNEWEGINFSHVPSQASRIYASAFHRHDPERYSAWKASLEVKDSGAKINTGALYPHEVVQQAIKNGKYPFEAAWESLQEKFPETKEKILPVCDVSGSMIGLPMDVCVSLGLFLSQRNTGPFQDCFITFSGRPKLQKLTGNLRSRLHQLQTADWGMSTNLEAVFKLIAKASEGAKPEDVPSTILIMSDMQFNACTNDAGRNAYKMYKKIFEERGLKIPKVVFWNLRDSGKSTMPVKADKEGTALISGFSPSILGGILGNPDDFTPMAIMLKILNSERYAPIKI